MTLPQRRSPDRARFLQLNGQALVLRGVHTGQLRTRADLTHVYGFSRGSACELTARLRVAALLDERPVISGRRGRPSAALGPHPDGPLVCAVNIGFDGWHVALVALGGEAIARRRGSHADRRPETVLAAAAAAARVLASGRHGRIAVISVAVAATVCGRRIVQASTLRWGDVDVAAYFADLGRPVLLGNDATLAGLAEARRGTAIDSSVSLNLWIGVGIGGGLVVDGQPQTGATGAGAEFGHLPFGDPRLRCPCGASGCWELEVDGRALARVLGARPADPYRFARRVFARARAGDVRALDAVEHVAAAAGRGAGALVNALDPELVTLFDHGTDLLALGGTAFHRAYRQALMAFRRAAPPPVLASTAPEPASLTGAAEHGFDYLLSEMGLYEWRQRQAALAASS